MRHIYFSLVSDKLENPRVSGRVACLVAKLKQHRPLNVHVRCVFVWSQVHVRLTSEN
jgi:hypothetical protein